MDRLQKYIIEHLSMLFLSIFLPLFTIASVIFLIKLASYTAVIQLSVLEMGKLYVFVLPEVLFFTLPFSFFIAISLTLFRLSTDNEIVVLFSLGIHPNFILKTFLKPALFLSVLLLFNFLVLYPHAKTLYKNFYAYKKSEAKFNLSASEFGHSFGEWLLYIGKDNPDGTFEDVFLFKKSHTNSEEVLISAKNAKIINDSSILRLRLKNGEGYSYHKDEFSQVNFSTMYINDAMSIDLKKYETPIEYWQSDIDKDKKKRIIITNTLMSLFPLLSLFLAATIGIVHIRHNKGKIYLYLFLGIIAYYEAILSLRGPLGYLAIPTVISLWSIVTYLFYKKIIVNKF